MAEHAALRGDAVLLDHRIEHLQQAQHLRQVVGGGVDADHRVAGAHQQAVEQAGGDAGLVVGRVVGLQSRGQAAALAQGAAELRDHLAFACDQQQVLQPAELAHRGDHLRRQPGRQRGQGGGVGGVVEQPVAEVADGQVRDRRKGGGVVAVDDQARDLVGLVGNQGLAEEHAQRQLGQRQLRGHALQRAAGGEPGELVARAARAGLGEQLAQVGKDVALRAEVMVIGHGRAVCGVRMPLA